MTRARTLLAVACLLACSVAASPPCDVYMEVEGGRVCGRVRRGANGSRYRSFRGVPFAKQPLGELRFKELQPVEPWKGILTATEDGPACPQHDVFYGNLRTPKAMNEACIHVNIHIPEGPARPTRELRLSYAEESSEVNETGLPILVNIHGGGFAYGSGDADFHGPEYLVSKGVIVITFNYRLNVFGFLSLNTTSIPGNQGLRDMVTLLRWVQRNARAMGGDPDDVTLIGQSAGAAAAHLLTLSPVAQGLFKGAILLSGTALPSFFATSPNYASYVANQFLHHTNLMINSTDPEDIHQYLINAPIEDIIEANRIVQNTMGITAFFPVIETHEFPGVTRILDDDTTVLIQNGRGKDIPLLVGYTNVECENFRPAFEKIHVLDTLMHTNYVATLPVNVLFTRPTEDLPDLVGRVAKKYFNGNLTMDKYVQLCSDVNFEYPALRLAEYRKETGGAPMYLYQFSYSAKHSVMKKAFSLDYPGAGHAEDLTFVFHTNSIEVKYDKKDGRMKDLMTDYIVNFMRCRNPMGPSFCATWPPIDDQVWYLNIDSPDINYLTAVTENQKDLLTFFEGFERGS